MTPAWTGSVPSLLSGALAGILLGVSQGSEWGWGSTANVVSIGGGLLLRPSSSSSKGASTSR